MTSVLPGQLTLELERRLDRDLARLGESPEMAHVLLQLLDGRGWRVHITRAFAGDGLLVVARLDPFEVKASGADLGELARRVFKEASLLEGAANRRAA